MLSVLRFKILVILSLNPSSAPAMAKEAIIFMDFYKMKLKWCGGKRLNEMETLSWKKIRDIAGGCAREASTLPPATMSRFFSSCVLNLLWEQHL